MANIWALLSQKKARDLRMLRIIIMEAIEKFMYSATQDLERKKSIVNKFITSFIIMHRRKAFMCPVPMI